MIFAGLLLGGVLAHFFGRFEGVHSRAPATVTVTRQRVPSPGCDAVADRRRAANRACAAVTRRALRPHPAASHADATRQPTPTASPPSARALRAQPVATTPTHAALPARHARTVAVPKPPATPSRRANRSPPRDRADHCAGARRRPCRGSRAFVSGCAGARRSRDRGILSRARLPERNVYELRLAHRVDSFAERRRSSNTKSPPTSNRDRRILHHLHASSRVPAAYRSPITSRSKRSKGIAVACRRASFTAVDLAGVRSGLSAPRLRADPVARTCS